MTPDDDHADAARRDESRSFATLDGEPIVIRPLTIDVTAEETADLDAALMLESVLLRTAQQAAEDLAILAFEEDL